MLRRAFTSVLSLSAISVTLAGCAPKPYIIEDDLVGMTGYGEVRRLALIEFACVDAKGEPKCSREIIAHIRAADALARRHGYRMLPSFVSDKEALAAAHSGRFIGP